MSAWTMSRCPWHGQPVRRATCRACNAAYMKDYMRRRRVELPTQPLVERARKRAAGKGIEFCITRADIVIPKTCPVLGIPLIIGGKRSANSPSLDRIDAGSGYVPGNVRVISDRANRLKGARSLEALRRLSEEGSPQLRAEYRMVADYVTREELLREVRRHATSARGYKELLCRLVPTLDRIFAEGLAP